MGFFFALRFLTIFPIPLLREGDAREIGRSVVSFPLVGLVLGFLLLGLGELFDLFLPLSLTNVLLVAAGVILTGALHLDGWIDTCDGAFIRSTPEERLRVMADSRVGSFGVAGACLLLLTKYLALAAVPDEVRKPALVMMPLASRWAVVCAIGLFRYARDSGTGTAFKAQVGRGMILAATLVTLLLSAMLAGFSGLALMGSVWLLLLAIAGLLAYRLGGLTGDGYGAINEVTEVLSLVLLPLLADVLSTHFLGPWDVFHF